MIPLSRDIVIAENTHLMCNSTPADCRILEMQWSCAYGLRHTGKGLKGPHIVAFGTLVHNSTVDKYSMAKTESSEIVMYSKLCNQHLMESVP